MKKTFIGMALLITACNIGNAGTYYFQAGTDVVKTNTPVETMWGYDAEYYITVTNPLPPNASYAVAISGKNILSSANINSIDGLNTFIRDGLGGSSYFPGTTEGSANFTSPASGSVDLEFDPQINGTCNAWANHCRIPRITTSMNVPITSASVNLNITGLQNMLHSFFSLFTIDFASADAQ